MWGKVADKRGVMWFLGGTFALTWTWDIGIFLLRDKGPGIFQGGVAISMFFPALMAVLVSRFVLAGGASRDSATPTAREAAQALPTLRQTLKFGPLRYYLHVLWIAPSLFALMYAVTWLTGAGRFDPSVTYLFNLIRSFGMKLDPKSLAVLRNPIYIPVVFIGSLTYGPVINSLVAFGEELGWRGFLWPRLAPMGFWPASIVSGLVWGLWHAVIIVLMGFNYPGQPVLGVLMMCAWVTMLGAWMNWLFTKTGSSVLAAWVHGVFNSQGYGIWRALTWPVNNLVGGFTGIIGVAALSIPAIWLAATGRIKAVD